MIALMTFTGCNEKDDVKPQRIAQSDYFTELEIYLNKCNTIKEIGIKEISHTNKANCKGDLNNGYYDCQEIETDTIVHLNDGSYFQIKEPMDRSKNFCQ